MEGKNSKSETLVKDRDLEVKVKRCMERVSENIHISSNEPSLALYRLQEHVRRALPPTVTRRQHVLQLKSQLQGSCYDVEYALNAVHGMPEGTDALSSIQELLKDAIFYKKQIKYEQNRRKKESSMYKRFSNHLTNMDLPDLPEAFRDTASRVESAFSQARSSYDAHAKSETSVDNPVDDQNEEKNDDQDWA